MRAFLRQAEDILDVAVEGDSDSSGLAIVIDRQGKLAANFEGNEFSAEQLGDFVAVAMEKQNY